MAEVKTGRKGPPKLDDQIAELEKSLKPADMSAAKVLVQDTPAAVLRLAWCYFRKRQGNDPQAKLVGKVQAMASGLSSKEQEQLKALLAKAQAAVKAQATAAKATAVKV